MTFEFINPELNFFLSLNSFAEKQNNSICLVTINNIKHILLDR